MARSGSDHTSVSRTWVFAFFFFFFLKLFLTKTSIAIPRSHRPGFFCIPFLTWDVRDHTTDPVCETGVSSLTSQSKLSTPLGWQTVVWPLTFWSKTIFKNNGRTPGLWDRGVATGGPGQKPVRKKRPGLSDSGYGLWRVKKKLTTVQIHRLENIEHKSMKQISYGGKYSLSASRVDQSHLQFSFVVGMFSRR